MILYAANVICLVLTALSLGPSYAHVLEALPRLTVWPRAHANMEAAPPSWTGRPAKPIRR
jgi:hypothetical protein